MDNKLDNHFLSFCEIVSDSSIFLHTHIDEIGMENDCFRLDEKTRTFVRTTLLILESYYASMSLIVSLNDIQDAGTIMRSSLELSIPLTLMFQNKDLYYEFSKFREFFFQKNQGNDKPLVKYAKEHHKINKKGDVFSGYEKYGWIDLIRENGSNSKYTFQAVVDCLKHETSLGYPAYQNYRVLSTFTHQSQLFGEFNKNQECFNILNSCLSTLRYLYETFEQFIKGISNDEYKTKVALLRKKEEELQKLGDSYF